MRKFWTLACLALAVVAFGQKAPTVSFVPPKDAVKPGATFAATVTVAIPTGLHAYSNPPTEEGLIPLEVKAVKGAKLLKATYPKGTPLQFAGHQVGSYNGTVKIGLSLQLPKDAAGTVEVTLHYQLCNDAQCFMPGDVVAKGTVRVAGKTVLDVKKNETVAAASTGKGLEEGLAANLYNWYRNGQWYLWMPAVLLVGLLINLTPCVYPVIAPTAGFIARQASGAGRFGFGIVFLIGAAAVFGAVGTIFGASGKVFGSLYQTNWFTIMMGVLMMLLALAMFDVYQIKLPGGLASGARGRGGLLGALLMGMFIGVAAVPCGGPVIATAAATVLQTKDYLFAGTVFTLIGVGLGLPVTLLIFTGALGVLARPGEWMNTVKHVLGLAVIASGLYFLQFSLKPAIGEEGMAGVWAAFFLLSAFYLLVLDHTGRAKTGILTFKSLVAMGAVFYSAIVLQPVLSPPVDAEETWRPLDLGQLDATLGKGKPIIIDFRADWCAKCREIEDKTFTDPNVKMSLSGMVAYRADETNDSATVQAWNERFGISALPVVLFFNGEGKLVKRFETYFDVSEFMEAATLAHAAR